MDDRAQLGTTGPDITGTKVIASLRRTGLAWKATLRQLRRDPSSFATLGLSDVVDHYEQIVRELESPPIIIGYGFGGLVTQILLDRGWGAAGAAITSAPVKGIALLPLSVLKLAFSVIGKSLSNKTASLTAEQFHQRVRKLADGNRIARRLQTLRRAGSESGSVANSIGKVHFRTAQRPSTFGTTRARHCSWSLRGKDRVVPKLTCQSELRALSRIESRN